MASSIASLVPEPIEKCAVCAASPSRTTLPVCHRSHLTRTNESQGCARWCGGRLASSGWPPSHGANIASHAAIVPSMSSRSQPALRHDSGSHSTMNADSSSLNR